MAEYQTVEINENTEAENISLEEQAKMQEEAAQNTPEGERPEWLDEKFKSPEDLAKAYEELQKKQGKGEDIDEDVVEDGEEPTEITSEASNTITNATEEFAENGTLSDDTFEALEKAGIPRAYVESYIAGQTALVTSEAEAVKAEVGGAQSYEAMLEWAGENLTETEIDAYNSMVESGNVAQAKVAAKGLYAQMVSAGGKPPTITQGQTSGPSVAPFTSTAQITSAMADSRYADDPAYRQQVENRIAVSNVI